MKVLCWAGRVGMLLALCVGLGLSASAVAQQAYTLRAPVPAKVEHRGQSNVDLGDFYQVGEERIDLLRRADQLVVQLRASANADVVGDLVAPSGPLEGFEAVRDFGNGLRMFANPALSAARMAPATAYASLRDTLSRLDADARVQFAVPVFVNAELGTYAVATDELLVRLKPGVRPETFFADARFARFEQAPASDAHLVRVAAGAGEPVLAVAAALQGDPRILWAEPNFYQERQRFFTPNDTLFPDQWHLNNTGQGGGTPGADAKLVPAWDVATTAGEGVVIAIVDDGPELTHPDLAIYTNPGEIAGNAIDDDGNGFIDDVRGWDFTSADGGDNDGGPSVVADQHGTAVAGVAAARGNNAAGVTGAAFRATIFPSTIFVGPTATSDANIGAALAYASGRARTPGTTNWRGADIVNNSWGGGGPSTAINDALTWAATNGRGGLGTPHFFATGNFAPNPMWRPAALSGTIASVIAVGASNNLDVRSSYSQFGPQLDFVAPSNGGTLAVWTTDRLGAPGYNGLADPDYTNRFGGTSSATPLAAGVGALLLGLEPTLTIPQLRALMRGTTDRIGPLAYDANGFNMQYGYGRINAKQAVRALNHARVAVTLGATSIVSAAPLSRTTQAGETQTLTFSVRSVGQLDLNLSELQFTGPASFTLSRPLGATTLPLGQSTTFEVSFTSLTAGTFNATASFTTNDADLPTFTIPIQFTVSPVSIGGQVFEDRNGDGVIQSGESALAGFTVYLDLDNSGTMNPPTESTVNSAANLGLIFTNTTPTSHSLAASGLGSELQGLEVRVTLTHAHVSDVRLVLEAPDGRSIELVSGGQGGSFDNMTNTVFADDATVAIVAGTPPYTGRFRPNQPLSTFLVSNPNGSWTLRAFDIDYFGLAPQENGTLVNWSLTLRHSGEPRRTSNAVGVYTFLGLAPGNYPVRRAPSSGWSQVSPADAHLVTMVGNESNVGRHFGLARHDSVYGKVYDDVDGNGAFNPGTDTARAGATVFLDINGNDALDATVEPNQITDSLGNFHFGNVSGSNSLRVIRPAGLRLSEPVTGSYPLSLAAGQFVQNRNFGLAPAGVTVTPTAGLTTTEAGGTATFTVVLNAQPTADVSIGLSSSDETEGTVSPTSLAFTPANWNSAQTVTVAGVDDAVADGAVAYSIVTAAATSADTAYEGVNATDVSVSNTDNDTAGINVTPTGNLVTTEAGGTATFTVVLTSQPTADVSIGLSSSDATEGTVNPTSLTFTPANWNTAQTVTITGVDDAMVDGNFTYAILTAPATSADPAYAGIDPPNVGVNNTDNDVAGVTVTPSGGSTTVTEGGATDTYTLVLTSQPTVNVVIAIAGGTQLTATPSPVTFTAANWNVAQTVTVSAVDDAVVEGSHSGSIGHTVTSSDTFYDGLTVAGVTATITDNDNAGVTVTQSGGNTAVTEAGASDTYTLVLTSQPTANVTVAVNPNAQLSQSPASVVFTPATWNAAQTVTVSAVDDAIAEGTHSGEVTHTVTSADTNYNGLSVAGVTATITDNDNVGVTVTPTTGLTTTEAGGTASFTVVLTSQPTADVSIGLSSSDPTEGAVSPTSLTFTAANWNTARTVTVTGVDDVIVDGNVGYTIVTAAATSSDSAYAGFNAADVSVSNTDNDVPGVTVTPTTGLTTTEAGGTASFTVVLNTLPSADVTIGLSSNDNTEGTVSPSSLTFTAANWNSAQTVTVTGVDDLIVDGSVGYTILTAAATSTDPAYAGFNAADISVSNSDNDVAGVTVTPTSGLTTTEAGGTATFTVALSAQPTADVTIGLSSNDTTEGTVGPTSLTFTAVNWNTAQTVTVTGVDDLIVDGSVAYSIVTAAATSTDPAFAGFNAADVSVSNTDNDVAGVTVSPTTGLTTTEAGGTATFTIVLTAQPTADVSIGLSSNDTTEGTVAPASLNFTTANWNTPRTVTVTGVDDSIIDGSISYSIVTGNSTSADAAFNGFNPSDVAVSNTDNDVAGVMVTQSGGTTAVTEGGSGDTFTLVLTAAPTSDVTITFDVGTQVSFTPNPLVITPAQWNMPQTVTVAAVDDAVAEGAHSATVGFVFTGDANFAAITPNSITQSVSITDNDNPGVTVTPTDGATAVTEGGSTDTYTLVLTSQPTANVVITLSGGTQLTATPSPVTFTPSTWNTPQTVTVTAVNDAVAEGTHNGSVTHTVTSADANYQNRLVDSVSATITDNDVAGVTVTQTDGNTAATEGGATDTLSVVLTSQPVSNVTVTINPNAQLSVSPSPLSFTAATWNVPQEVTVTAVNDAVVEGNHNGTLGFAVASNDPGYGSITLPTITASITDNDSAVVNFAPASVSQSEGAGAMVFTVTLSAPVASGVTVTVDSANGTAMSGSDYTAIVGQTVRFAAESTTPQTVSVAVTNDALDEDNETYTLTLSNVVATGAVTLGAASTATGTIEDDDALPALSVANVSQAESNAVNTLSFTVNLSPVSGRAVNFTRATLDGTAVSTGGAADFAALAAGPISIAAGQTSVTIPVTINGDTTFEGDEQFTLSLTGIANANVGSTTISGTAPTLSATATLTEDDQQPTTTTITADLPDPSVVGQPYPVTVEVRAQTLSPLGEVTITDGTGASCTAALTTGTAPLSTMSCTLTSTSAGAKTLTASYTPASEAFAASSDTEGHQVNAAVTSLLLLGPARARIGTVATYTTELGVIAPGSGTPAGTVTVSAGSNSCTITLPSATPSCTITYSTLGGRSVSAVFAPSNGNFVGSTATPVQTLVFASADISVTKSNGVNTYRPGDLLVYTVVVRNTGPDAAPQVRIRDVAPAGLTNVAWTCVASGSAICPDSGGTGTLDHVVATLPTGGTLTYAYFGNVTGRPAQIVNVAEVTLPVDTTIEDPNAGNNSATDTDLLDDLFANGFEAPGINSESGGVRLAGASLRNTLDEVARVSVRLSDIRGEALRVYARVVGGELQVALAVRGADGSLRLGNWQTPAGEPELVWTATPVAGGFVLSSATLR